VTLNHHREGSGEPLVLLHGTGSQWQVWEPLIERLAPHRDVIALDLPGFGESPPLDEPVVTPLRHTDAVVDFLDELGLDRPAIGGNSLGGTIGLELARRGRARSVVASSPAGFWTPREQRWCVNTLRVDQLMARRVARAAALFANPISRTLLFGGLVGKPRQMPAAAAQGAVANLARAPGFDATNDGLMHYVFARGEEVDVPVTILWGDHDYLLLPRQAPRAERVIPRATLVWLRGAGHVPSWDAPDEIAAHLQAA
jgi:pimeloyl-ACP methyl ester carboxylesterase